MQPKNTSLLQLGDLVNGNTRLLKDVGINNPAAEDVGNNVGVVENVCIDQLAAENIRVDGGVVKDVSVNKLTLADGDARVARGRELEAILAFVDDTLAELAQDIGNVGDRSAVLARERIRSG